MRGRLGWRAVLMVLEVLSEPATAVVVPAKKSAGAGEAMGSEGYEDDVDLGSQ